MYYPLVCFMCYHICIFMNNKHLELAYPSEKKVETQYEKVRERFAGNNEHLGQCFSKKKT